MRFKGKMYVFRLAKQCQLNFLNLQLLRELQFYQMSWVVASCIARIMGIYKVSWIWWCAMHDRSYIIISWLWRPGNEDHGFLSSVGLEREMIRDKVETSTIVSYITMATQQTHQCRNIIMNWKNCLFHLSLFKSQIISTTLHHQCRFFLEYYEFIQVNSILSLRCIP